MKVSNIFEKFLEFCVGGTKQIQSIVNGGDCFGNEDALILDEGEEFKLPETVVVEPAVPLDVKNEIDTMLIPLNTQFFEHPNEDQIGNRKRRGRPRGSKNKPRLKVEEIEENDPIKVGIISTLDDFKREDCFVERKEGMGGTKKNKGGTKKNMGGAKKKQNRTSERKARNGIISDLNQLNSITNSEFEIENNMKKYDESSLKVVEELGVEDSTTDRKSNGFEKERTAKKRKTTESESRKKCEKTQKGGKPTKAKKSELKLKEENMTEDEKPTSMKSELRLKADKWKSKHLYACSECPKSFRTSLHLKVHYFRHFPSTRNFRCFSCTICDKRFRGNYYLNNVHFRLHTDESFKPFPCPKCLRRFENAEVLAKHVLTHVPFMCEICGQAVKKRRRSEHMIKHRTWLKCDVCPRMFQSKSCLERHLVAHRNTKASVCPVCGHRSRNGRLMKQHMRSHLEKTFPCPTCSKLYPSMGAVTTHMQRFHANAYASCCELCGKTLGTITHLRRHMLTMHFGAKPFECTECGKKFTSNWYLKKHSKEKHGATFQFRCPHCRFDFNTADQLERHGDTCRNKPFQGEHLTCNQCGKRFERRSHLRDHQIRKHRTNLPIIPFRNLDLPSANQLTLVANIDSDFKQVALN